MTFLGPWVWNPLPFGHWEPPAGATACIDMRTLADQSTAVMGANAFGLFASDIDLGSDYRQFGDIPKESDRSIFAAMLGVKTVDGTTLNEWIASFFTLYADPFGLTTAKPITPNQTVMEVHLGGRIYAAPFDVNVCAKARAVMQETYRSTAAEDSALARKMLGYWGKQLSVNNPQDAFIPADMPKVQPLAPATTISDNFNRANSGTLGTSSEGWSWAAVLNTIGIVSNQADTNADGVQFSARAESDLSSTDHYAQVTLIQATTNSLIGPAARFSSSASTFYKCNLYTGDNHLYLDKLIAGVETHLSNTAITPATPEPYKTECNGSTIKAYQNGVQRISITDTAITTGTRCGIGGYNNTSASHGIADDFTASDLATTTRPVKMAGEWGGYASAGGGFAG